jgi:hypothetical protein
LPFPVDAFLPVIRQHARYPEPAEHSIFPPKEEATVHGAARPELRWQRVPLTTGA